MKIPEESLRIFVNNLLKKPSTSKNSQNRVTDTQTMKDLSSVDPALLYFYHKFFPNDVDERVVDNVISELIHRFEKTRQTRQIRPLPTSKVSSSGVPKSESAKRDKESKKVIVLSELQRLLFDARALNVLQERAKRHDNISFRRFLSPEIERSKEASPSPAQDDGSHVSKQEVPPETKAQAQPASSSVDTPAVDVKSETKPSSSSGADNSKPSPGATGSGSQNTDRSKEAPPPSPVVQNSNGLAFKSEINGNPKSHPEPSSKPIQPSATDVKAGSEGKPPPTTAKADRPKEAPAPAVPDNVLRGEVNGTKTQPQSGESRTTSVKPESSSASGSTSKPSQASAANPASKEQPTERSKPTVQNDTQGGNKARTQSQPAPKSAESSSANVKPKVEPGSDSSGSTSKPAPTAAATSKTTKAAESETGTGTETKAPDRPTRVTREESKKVAEEVISSAAYARERPSKSRLAQDGRGRVVPKPAAIPDPAPEIKREPKKEEKTETKPTAGSAGSSSAKVDSTPSLKEEKKPAHGETNGSSQSGSSSNGSAGAKKEKKSSSAAVNAAFEELFGRLSASTSRQSETRAKSPPPPRSRTEHTQPQPQPQAKPPHPRPPPPPQQPPPRGERTPPKPSPPSSPRTERAPPKPSPPAPPPRTEYAPPKPSPPSPPPFRAPPKPAPDPSGRYYTSYRTSGTVQCSGKTQKGVRCLNRISASYKSNSKIEVELFCYWHGKTHGSDIPMSVDPSAMAPERCSAITQAGTLCRRSAAHYHSSVSEYGYCTQHARIKGWIY